MKNLLKKLWHDDRGVVTAEYLTLGSVVVLGGIGGLSAMRDSVNSEMVEFGNSVK
jgi:Flp pilus assembly pilin Flp